MHDQCCVHFALPSKLCSGRTNFLNASPITEVAVGTFAYVDMRWYGYGWFEAFDLPDHDDAQYVVKFRYEAFNKERTVADIFCHVFKRRWKVNHVFVVEYGMATNFDATYTWCWSMLPSQKCYNNSRKKLGFSQKLGFWKRGVV
jgi:hypothetical protein